MPRLWAYHLHYFDWLWTFLPEEDPDWRPARRAVLDWIERHPPAGKACGWEPYPTSVRLMNWSLLFGVRHRARTREDEELLGAILRSVGSQARWLRDNLEVHLEANHLLENLAALACVAAVFEWEGRDVMGGRVLPLLEQELREQILPDGLHYERSPMYHLRMLWLVEMLAAAGDRRAAAVAAPLVEPMGEALAMLTHPDGEIALFNDAAQGVYAMPSSPPVAPPGPWALPEAGYYGWRGETGDYLAVDAAPIGPDHQPGHAHADFLSFELSIEGRRVVTDTGVASYEPGAGRAWDRSTAAHNTVEVEGTDSCEVWKAFRVGRRTRPDVTEWSPRGDGFVLEAAHRGYRHLPQKVTHTRRFEMRPGRLTIVDRLAGRGRFGAVARLHLAPGMEAVRDGPGVEIRGGGAPVSIRFSGPGRLVLESSPYSPEFGARVERTVVGWRVEADGAAAWSTTIGWAA